jgi:hypothetical protein
VNYVLPDGVGTAAIADGTYVVRWGDLACQVTIAPGQEIRQVDFVRSQDGSSVWAMLDGRKIPLVRDTNQSSWQPSRMRWISSSAVSAAAL